MPRLFGILGNSVAFINAEPRIPGCATRCARRVVTAFLVPTKMASHADVRCGSRRGLLRGTRGTSRMCVGRMLPTGVMCGLERVRGFDFLHSVDAVVGAIVTIVGW